MKTSIYHGSVERDEYFSTTWYGFGQALYDHNFSQGLDLQQTYGGGLGWSALHSSNQNLDLKFGVTYVRQQFSVAANDQNLSGSTFEEDYKRGLRRGITFNQQLILNPAWNDTNSVCRYAQRAASRPDFKELNFTLGAIDNYLHDPPPGFKKELGAAESGFELRNSVSYFFGAAFFSCARAPAAIPTIARLPSWQAYS